MGAEGIQWPAYNDAQLGRDPRPLCVEVLARAGHGIGRLALDLGAGAAVESRALLDAGWQVVAIDSDPALPRRVRELTGDSSSLEVRVAALEDAEIPEADLVHSGYALPFVHPDSFGTVWDRIREALRPGAWLAVDLFGERDSWAGRADMTFVDRERVEAMLAGLRVVMLDEEDRDGTSMSGPKHWHVFHVIARRPLTHAAG